MSISVITLVELQYFYGIVNNINYKLRHVNNRYNKNQLFIKRIPQNAYEFIVQTPTFMFIYCAGFINLIFSLF